MTRMIQTLADVSDRYDALFCDLWGCVHDGFAPFPGVVDGLKAFRAKGGAVLLLTNAPRPSAAVIRQLGKIGVPDDAYDLVVSSGDASQDAVAAGVAGQQVFHLGPAKDHSFFETAPGGPDMSGIERVPLDRAQGIVCTGLFDETTETPVDYRATFLMAKQRQLPLVCTNPDIVVDMGDTRVYCAGALAALYTEMGGRSLYFGKPHPPIYDLARRRLAAIKRVPDEGILCIGDGIATDIQGGMAEGLDTAFVTGGLAAAEFGPDPLSPDPKRVAAYLAAAQLSATFAIPKLR